MGAFEDDMDHFTKGEAAAKKVADDNKNMTVFDLADFTRMNIERSQSPDGFNHQLSDWSLSDWMTAAMGELGEAANIVKKMNRNRDNIRGNKETEDQLRVKLAGELADVFIYLNLMTVAAGLSPTRIVRDKFNRKSEEIGYAGPRL